MSVQWVIKTTKLCNLRCRYCYEYPWLGDPARISAPQLDRFFRNIASFYQSQPQQMDFVWHGGEPLLLGADFYDTVFRLQEQHLTPACIPFENSIQTNGTRVSPQDIALLRQFKNVGLSIDLFGDHRVDAADRPSQTAVLHNMQILLDAHISFGCITVLSRQNRPFLPQIFSFFAELGLAFRILPIYRTGFFHQHGDTSLTQIELLSALVEAVDLWFDLKSPIQVRPIHDYVLAVLRQYSAPINRMTQYGKKTTESLFIVNTDGQIFSNADAYASEYSYGNIFDSPLQDLLSSAGYHRSRSERRDRLQAACEVCSFYGACSGFYIGEATPEQRFHQPSGDLVCSVVQPLLQHIEARLLAEGVIDPATRQINPAWDHLSTPASDAVEF